MFHDRPRTLLLLAPLLGACAAHARPAPICTTEARAGLRVEVRNAETAGPESEGATVTASAPRFSEVLEPREGPWFVGVFEREGTYELRVEKPGFEPWVREDVRVERESDGCHVSTRELRADLVPVAGAAAEAGAETGPLVSIALRVHRMEAMEGFYSEAFGVRFRDVRTGPFVSRFGELGDVTLKLVPIREAVDFEGFPVHQPGVWVDDVEAVIRIAERWGGRLEGEVVREDGLPVRAAVRDPDGNTIELYRIGSAVPEG